MRRKIAKKKRREVLRRATIIKEGWIREGKKRKERCYSVDAQCNGWDIHSIDEDELWAYKGVLSGIEAAEELGQYELWEEKENGKQN